MSLAKITKLGIIVDYGYLDAYLEARQDVEDAIRHSRSIHKKDPFETFVWVLSFRNTTPAKDPNIFSKVIQLPEPSWRIIAEKGKYRTISKLFNAQGLVPGNWPF